MFGTTALLSFKTSALDGDVEMYKPKLAETCIFDEMALSRRGQRLETNKRSDFVYYLIINACLRLRSKEQTTR